MAIGNSITGHPANSYWWNEGVGMAASDKDHDYVSLIKRYLQQYLLENENTEINARIRTEANAGINPRVTKVSADAYKKVTCHKYYSAAWERMSTDRFETLEFLDPYLNGRIDLITIQWGENASDISTFQTDFEELIKYIQERIHKTAQKVNQKVNKRTDQKDSIREQHSASRQERSSSPQIIVIGDFWENENRDEQKKQACLNAGVKYLDLKEIKDNAEYWAGMGTVVYGADGAKHRIEHSGVAKHPGDEGMRYIAEKVIEEVRQQCGNVATQ